VKLDSESICYLAVGAAVCTAIICSTAESHFRKELEKEAMKLGYEQKREGISYVWKKASHQTAEAK
jgi:hypothetical protein